MFYYYTRTLGHESIKTRQYQHLTLESSVISITSVNLKSKITEKSAINGDIIMLSWKNYMEKVLYSPNLKLFT